MTHCFRQLRFAVSLLLVALCLWGIGGCARERRQANTLRLSTKVDPSTLDPARAYDTTSIRFVRVLYRGLVDYDNNAGIVDEVAKSHRVSADGKVYSFVLRPDVRFQSGRRVTAADFRYAIERVLDPTIASDGLTFYQIIDGADAWSAERAKSGAKHRFQHVAGIVVNGDDRIEFHLVRPDATFLNMLTLPFAYAVPQDWVEKLEKNGQTLSENPDGCGPFTLESWQHNGWVRLVKNPHYFHPALPKVDRINVQIGGDDTLAQMRFELGDLDIQDDIPPVDFDRLTHDPKWQPYIMHAPMMDIRYLCMNTEMAPFTDVRVRRAFNYAIDKSKLIPIRGGQITAANAVLPEGVPGYDPNLKGYSYDPAKARALLKEAGCPNLEVTLSTSPVQDYDKIAQSIQQDLKQVGVKVNIDLMEYPELKTLAGKRHELPLSLMGWLQDYPDPSDYLDVLFNSDKITSAASLNRAFYSNPQVDRLLDNAGIELNMPKRLKLYNQAEQQILNDAPWVCLYHTENYVMEQPWVTGYHLNPMWSICFEDIGVTDPGAKP